MYFLSLRNTRLGTRFHLIMSRHRAHDRPKRESQRCNAYFCTTTVRYIKGGRGPLLARTMSMANRSLPAALERESSFLRRLCIPQCYASRRLQRRKNSECRLHSALSEIQAFFLFSSFNAYFLHESRSGGFKDFY